MGTAYIVWCREDCKVLADSTGKATMFTTSALATTAATDDPRIRNDVTPKRPAKTFDVITVTV
jgi:hypothetical protein